MDLYRAVSQIGLTWTCLGLIGKRAEPVISKGNIFDLPFIYG